MLPQGGSIQLYFDATPLNYLSAIFTEEGMLGVRSFADFKNEGLELFLHEQKDDYGLSCPSRANGLEQRGDLSRKIQRASQ
jgi:hypothetical protein